VYTASHYHYNLYRLTDQLCVLTKQQAAQNIMRDFFNPLAPTVAICIQL